MCYPTIFIRILKIQNCFCKKAKKLKTRVQFFDKRCNFVNFCSLSNNNQVVGTCQGFCSHQFARHKIICKILFLYSNTLFLFKHDMKVSYTLLYVRLSHSRSHIKSFLHYKTLFCVFSISLSISHKMIYGEVVIYLIYTEYLNDWNTLLHMVLFFLLRLGLHIFIMLKNPMKT